MGLRLWGIGFGLPELFHPDEPAYVLQALAVGGRLPNGLTFANPPLFKYLLLAEYAATFGVERLVGASHSTAEFVDQFRVDPSLLYTIARATSGLLGAFVVLAASVLATQVAGRRVGVIAAGLSAVTFLLVREAHFGTDDTLVTLLVTLGLVPCARIAQGRGGPRDYALAGALAGLAFDAKYDGIALLAPLVAAHLSRHGRTAQRALAIDARGAHDALPIDAPTAHEGLTTDAPTAYEGLATDAPTAYEGLATDAPTAYEGLATDAPTAYEGLAMDAPTAHEGVASDAPIAHEGLSSDAPTADEGLSSDAPTADEGLATEGRTSRMVLVIAFGACAVAAVVGFPSLVTEPGRVVNDVYVHLYLSARGGYDGIDPSGGYVFYARTLLVGLGWPLALAAGAGMLLSAWRRDAAALVVALLPIAMLLALGSQQLYFARFVLPTLPALIVEASVALEALMRRRMVVGAVAAALVALPTLVDSVRFDVLLTQTDTRTLARQWIDAQLPPTAKIASDAPPLAPTIGPEHADVVVASDTSLFELAPDEYRAGGVEYLVVSSFIEEARAIDPAREARRVAFASELSSQASLVAQFRPYAGGVEPAFNYDEIYGPYTDLGRRQRLGPTISIYRLT